MPPRLSSFYHRTQDDLETSGSIEDFDLDDANFESRGLTTDSYVHRQPLSWTQYSQRLLPLRLRALYSGTAKRKASRRYYRYQSVYSRRLGLFFYSLAGLVSALVLATALFRPSYNNPPEHYGALLKRVLASDQHGRGNVNNEKIFIAASLYDGDGTLVDGAWGRNVLNLIDLLGHSDVFLSLYENGNSPNTRAALKRFEKKVRCNNYLIFEEQLSTEDISRVKLPDGSERIKRIAFLAETRNRALKPLGESSNVTYDKVLFLNDVLFNPVDAVQLLFSTNANEKGKASYNAACAVDFINPFKFYDTFATRDLEGYSMGVPFFPWYANAGHGSSRHDVLDGKDAVRVKSCWGGMVAFDARFLQASGEPFHDGSTDSDRGSADAWTPDHLDPIRFRAIPSLDWDASECCLIHADILKWHAQTAQAGKAGIYQNPYVRVSYGPWTLWWLPITRRVERLYTFPHAIVNRLVGLPWYNPRRVDIEEPEIHGSAGVSGSDPKSKTLIGGGDGYCGIRTLQLLRETPGKGEKNWETVPISSG